MEVKELETVFEAAKRNGHAVGVEVTIPGQSDTEFIVNRHQSISNKLAYYKKTYDDQLVHRNCAAIKIVNVFEIAREI